MCKFADELRVLRGTVQAKYTNHRNLPRGLDVTYLRGVTGE